jgi:hypothetical protein
MSHGMKQMVFGGVLVLFGFVTMNAVGTFLAAMMGPIPVGRAGGTAWQVYVLRDRQRISRPIIRDDVFYQDG